MSTALAPARTRLELMQAALQMTKQSIASASTVEIIRYRVVITPRWTGKSAGSLRHGRTGQRMIERYLIKADGVAVARNLTRRAAEKLAGRKYIDPAMALPYLCEYINCFSVEGIERAIARATELGGKLYRSSTTSPRSTEYRIIAPPSARFKPGMMRVPLATFPENLIEITHAEDSFSLHQLETK